MSEHSPAADKPIVATGGLYYRRMRYFIVLATFGVGLYFAYDGWIGYPAKNARREQALTELNIAQARHDPRATELLEQLKDLPSHSDMDLLVQKLIAVGVPILGIALLIWALYNSRGEIRLTPDLLTAPGHPPVTMDQITALDKRLWDKKDIAYVEYEVGASKGKIRLDAFVYQADPIVHIFDRIEALMQDESA